VLKRVLRRVRSFLGAELMDEIKALRAELARRDAAVEAALLTIALREEASGGLRPHPPGPEAPDPH